MIQIILTIILLALIIGTSALVAVQVVSSYHEKVLSELLMIEKQYLEDLKKIYENAAK